MAKRLRYVVKATGAPCSILRVPYTITSKELQIAACSLLVSAAVDATSGVSYPSPEYQDAWDKAICSTKLSRKSIMARLSETLSESGYMGIAYMGEKDPCFEGAMPEACLIVSRLFPEY